MTINTQNSNANITPNDYQYLVSETSREALVAANLTVHIEPSDYFPICGFPFASMFEQIPNPSEYAKDSVNGQIHTVIKADEVGDTDDATVKNVLARLGVDINDTHYWKVYAYELDTPNEEGLTKLLTTRLNDVPKGEVKFAGFGYKSAENVESDAKQNEELADRLYYASLCLNKKLMTVMLRDADSGQHAADYECAIDVPMVSFNAVLQKRIAAYKVRKENHAKRSVS